MPTTTILYWRDIPAQVIAKEGRRTAKRVLAARFAEAIDMAAMKSGAGQEDVYLAQWRRGENQPCGDDLEAEVAQVAARLEADYPADRLKALILAHGNEHMA
ncbi:MAG: virulence factor [Novosphingobium sp.]|jgi:hypothetical protein|uniref:virulence factor n=1 Tax=Novosphingobium sp. TaxID=1874826 RepID=UPI003B9BEED0